MLESVRQIRSCRPAVARIINKDQEVSRNHNKTDIEGLVVHPERVVNVEEA